MDSVGIRGSMEISIQSLWDVSYLGELKESLKHGYGIEQFANGDIYQGNYLNGRPCGFGEYHWANGARYKGNFQNGLRFGKGIYTRSTDQY